VTSSHRGYGDCAELASVDPTDARCARLKGVVCVQPPACRTGPNTDRSSLAGIVTERAAGIAPADPVPQSRLSTLRNHTVPERFCRLIRPLTRLRAAIVPSGNLGATASVLWRRMVLPLISAAIAGSSGAGMVSAALMALTLLSVAKCRSPQLYRFAEPSRCHDTPVQGDHY
jgi:hypothetical protein